MKSKKFDVIVIGSGSGLEISSEAAGMRMKVAVIDEGPFGGTCLNRGCIPSKMLIHSADVAETVKRGEEFGVSSKIVNINWDKVQNRTWEEVDGDAKSIEKGNRSNKNITVYKKMAKFIGKKLVKVGNETITADKIFIGAGSRPRIIDLPGLDKIKYYTSDDVMRVKKQPKSMIIIGGGYIATELGHFFGSLGTGVTIVNRSGVLIRNEDEEISKAYTEIAQKKFNVLLNTDAVRVGKSGNKIDVEIKTKGEKKKLSAELLLLAVGRVPNTDILDVKKTGVKTDEKGFVKVNDYLETNVKGIWAMGDIVGRYMLKHNANLEAQYCAHNAFNPKKKVKIDYTAMPHAIFTSPQIGSVGMTEQELKKNKIKYFVGKYRYYDTAMGKAIEDKAGFVKVLADENRKILGCHIIGSDASNLIHEVIVVMKSGLGVSGINRAVHIHPALNEVVQRAFGSIIFK